MTKVAPARVLDDRCINAVDLGKDGSREDFLPRATRDDLAAIHHHELIAVGGSQVEVVQGGKNGSCGNSWRACGGGSSGSRCLRTRTSNGQWSRRMADRTASRAVTTMPRVAIDTIR